MGSDQFDYDQPPVDAIPVADAIRGLYRLPELTPEQQQQRRIDQAKFREELAWQTELARIEQDQHRAEVEAAQRQEAAAEIAENNRQARERMRQEYIVRQERQSRSNDLAILRNEAQQSALWRNQVRNAVAYQQRQTLLNELEAAITPPPEPANNGDTIVYGQDEGSPELGSRNFNPELFNKKPRSWW